MDITKPIEWTKIKCGWLGFQGDQLLCIVEKVEDLPVEGYAPNILQDIFTTPESAMAHGERILHRIANHEREHDEPRRSPGASLLDMVLPMMKSLIQTIENPAGVKGGFSQPSVVGPNRPTTQPSVSKIPQGATHQMLYQSKSDPTARILAFMIDGKLHYLMASGLTQPWEPGHEWILRSTLDYATETITSEPAPIAQ